MEFRILGRLEIRSDDGEPITVSQPLIRSAISVLVLKSGQALSSDQLQALLWEPGADGDRADRTGAIKTCVAGVRRVLSPDRVPPGHGGYRLRLGDRDTVDLVTFRDLLVQAREARGRGDAPLAAELYERALALWRDPPLDDLPETSAVAGIAAGLLDERRVAREELVEIRLALGRHRALVPELRAWVLDDPLNEYLWAQLLLALYRSGRKTEALQAYDEAHEMLEQAAGSEPGPELQRMWHRIKVDDPDLNPHPPPHPAPGQDGHSAQAARPPRQPLARQLPPDVRDFTGRETQRGRLRQLLASAAMATAPPVVQISGPPGVGKTSLALHVAHLVTPSFPDGQLYVQLAGASQTPRDPAAVLNEVLRAIGVAPADIPGTLPERAALYRSRLAGKRVLVVADDAAAPGQIQPLLPGTPGCAILITSRNRSLGLDGAHLLALERLSRPEGLRMLGRIIGPHRVAAEEAAAARVVEACDGFPLAVRIVGARLAGRPTWPLAHMAGLLTEPERRLDHLVAGNTAVRALIEASYQSLDERARRAFRMLALAGPHDFAPWVVGVLLDDPSAEEVVDTLVDKSLLSATGVDQVHQPRYRLHDLLRDYAAEQLAGDAEAEPALERLTIGWLELVDHADSLVPRDPYFPPPSRFTPRMAVSDELVKRLIEPDPAAWFTSELANLRTAVTAACAAGRFRLATGLVLRMASHLHLHHLHEEAEHLWRIVAAAAERESDAPAAARARFRAAKVIAADRGRPAEALPLIDDCAAVFAETDSRQDLARALELRAFSVQCLGRPYDARDDAEHALQLARKVGDPHTEFAALRVLGLVCSQTGDPERAIAACEESLAIARGLGHATYQSSALHSLIRVHLAAGDFSRLPSFCEEGLRLSESIGHKLGEAYFHELWGRAHQELGRHEQAVAHLETAAELFADLGRADDERRARASLGELSPGLR
ncbi:AfsR/SARP family transcriptional regulator [Actinomadura rudentiformis]|uniref:Tetratricopeptide repeat protein n=1 Tax=Actinomadura rudentiformis TaxID=359158 RepID=A0A6H9Z1L3_9ACTN|nr:BTAD domain-containing putative transcriptional regulator [Actinomadura rudentiformis]KAB2347015.1 tetratricopeptide repeat protein [Actinomadura rudentiformis]